jgi:hypothetical protein
LSAARSPIDGRGRERRRIEKNMERLDIDGVKKSRIVRNKERNPRKKLSVKKLCVWFTEKE